MSLSDRNVSVLLKTSEHRGNHSDPISRAINCSHSTTIDELLQLIERKGDKKVDHIEIRFAEDIHIELHGTQKED